MLLWKGIPLWQHVFTRMAPQVASLTLLYSGNPTIFPEGLPITADLRRGHLGPLAGVETALTRMRTEWLFTAPVDLPLLPRDCVAQMALRAKQGDVLVVCAESCNRIHGTVALWHRKVLPNVQQALDEKRYGVLDFLRQTGFATCSFMRRDDGVDPFLNLNRPEDFQHLPKD
ncbi:molybdenum cofactor guanylyltransferase [Magnetococcus marinus MC-1]|uniref:Molybdenum cofactor guanylyltransferase n=2 Tax=Magnetococcus TaxID=162171 RepID=A0L9K0_MAGMM|nr:molybdenum cofactor guanylyltransferase [Magnetococcus marinus MC-1]